MRKYITLMRNIHTYTHTQALVGSIKRPDGKLTSVKIGLCPHIHTYIHTRTHKQAEMPMFSRVKLLTT